MSIARKIHYSNRGVPVDMELLRSQQENTVALGNASMNARGDELGLGGKIVRRREDVIKEYYDRNPNGPQTVVARRMPEVFETPAQALERLKRQKEQEMMNASPAYDQLKDIKKIEPPANKKSRKLIEE